MRTLSARPNAARRSVETEHETRESRAVPVATSAADESNARERILLGNPSWVTARHIGVEIVRNLAKLLTSSDRTRMKKIFAADWLRFHIVELDDTTWRRAGELAETLQIHTFDALHLAAAERAGGSALPFLTYDLRQAQAARSLGWMVLGR